LTCHRRFSIARQLSYSFDNTPYIWGRGATASPTGNDRETDVTTTGLQKTAYALLIALLVYAWVVGG